MVNYLELFESKQIERLKNNNIQNFNVGDTVEVEFEVYENGVFIRNQIFEGVCIARKNRGINSSFILRKVSLNEAVERGFMLYSPIIKKAVLKRSGHVRRAKLYYLRHLSGKAARIKEKKSIRPVKAIVKDSSM